MNIQEECSFEMLLPFGSRDLQDSMISLGEEKRQRLKIHGKEECRDEITCLMCMMLFPLCWTEHCSTRHSSQRCPGRIPALRQCHPGQFLPPEVDHTQLFSLPKMRFGVKNPVRAGGSGANWAINIPSTQISQLCKG